MKKAFCLLIIVVFSTTQVLFAQATIAKLKYEDAEEAYGQANYELALSKLKDVEALLKGTNPKIMYLQILSQSKIIEKDPLNDWLLLKRTRELSERYLVDYENVPDNEDKYRDIYKASESLKKWPATVDEFRVSKEKKQGGQQEKSSVTNISLEQSRQYINTLSEKYKFKNGLTLPQFTRYNSEALPLSKTKGISEGQFLCYTNENALANSPEMIGFLGVMSGGMAAGYGMDNPFREGPYKIIVTKGLNTVSAYDFIISSGKEEQVVNTTYENVKSDIVKNINSACIKIVDGWIIINVPGSGVEIRIFKLEKNKWYSATIEFKTQ